MTLKPLVYLFILIVILNISSFFAKAEMAASANDESKESSKYLENSYHRVLYYAAFYEYNRMQYRDSKSYDFAIRLLQKILKDDSSKYSPLTEGLLADIYFKISKFSEAAEHYKQIGDIEKFGISLFQAGRIEEAKEVFENELAKPEKLNKKFIDWETPPDVRLKIWLAGCLGKLGKKDVARNMLYSLLEKSTGRMWAEDDQVMLVEELLENSFDDPAAMNRLREYAQKTKDRNLIEYFDIEEAILKRNIKQIIDYLSCPDRFI